MWFNKSRKRNRVDRKSLARRPLAIESLQARLPLAAELVSAMAVGNGTSGVDYRDVVVQNGARYVTLDLPNSSEPIDLDPLKTYADNRDIFQAAPTSLDLPSLTVVSKFDSSGSLQWKTQINGISTSLALDSAGTVYLSGYFVGNNVAYGSTTISAGVQADTILCKLNGSNGSLLMVKQVTNTPSIYESNSELIVSPDGGTAYVSANYSSGGYASSITKYQITGNTASASWSKSWVGGNLSIVDMKLVSTGQIVAAGVHRGATDFDPNAGTFSLNSGRTKTATNSAGFVMRLDSAGTLVWAKNFQAGSVGGSTVRSIVVDSNGINLAGSFSGTVDFDPGTAVRNLANQGGTDAFFVKLNTTGALVTASSFGSALNESTAQLVATASGGYVLSSTTTNASGSTQYSQFRQLNSNGSVLWTSKATQARVSSMAVDSLTMELHLVGSFFGQFYYSDSTGIQSTTPQLVASDIAKAYWIRIKLS